MAKRLFCEISPLTYKISVTMNILRRKMKWIANRESYAVERSDEKLANIHYESKSLIRRKLGNVDMKLQDNKAVNLSIAAPKINGIIIKPNQVFSFWKLVGNCTASKGYLEGLSIKNSDVSVGIGGGMCQMTNMIHWLILHSPLTVLEHHHHNQFDLFPDFGRTVPFGTGTSIMYNYMDYQFINSTAHTFQLIIYTTDEHLCGELRCDAPIGQAYHVEERNAYFSQVEDTYFRHNEVYKITIDKMTGDKVDEKLINRNKSKVLYDVRFIPAELVQ